MTSKFKSHYIIPLNSSNFVYKGGHRLERPAVSKNVTIVSMKFGFRTPSLKRRVSARTSWKRAVRHSMGIKAPRGMGIITNPKRSLYNKIYRKTTFGIEDLARTTSKKSKSSQKIREAPSKGTTTFIFFFLAVLVAMVIFPWLTLGIIVGIIAYIFYKRRKRK